MILHLDYETRSPVDLTQRGAYVYAADPKTEILCAAYAFDDGPVQFWNAMTEEIPDDLADALEAAGERGIHAHNAAFERLITWYVLCRDYDVKRPPLEAFYCTAAQARARALPAALEKLPRALGFEAEKDRRGKDLIRRMSIPPYEWSRELQDEMIEYCIQDVEIERLCAMASAPLRDDEWQDYLVSERINDRGICVDLEFANAAHELALEAQGDANADLIRLTNGQIETTRQHQHIKAWAFDRGTPEQQERLRRTMLRHKYNRATKETVEKLSFDRDTRETILALPDDLVHYQVQEMAAIVEEASSGSTNKYKAMRFRAQDDGRVRGSYIYAGAAQTLRFSATGVQTHNLRRDAAKDPEALRKTILEDPASLPKDERMNLLAQMLRPTLIAGPGNILVGGDWSAIEARVLPWLADDPDADEVLDVFDACDADPSRPDIYMVSYAQSVGMDPADVTRDQRQIGKVRELAFGYQGAVGAVMQFARAYGLTVDPAEALEWCKNWRRNNPWAPRFWSGLEEAAKDAVRTPGAEFSAGMVSYIMNPNGDLCAVLPGDLVILYPQARLDIVDDRMVLSSLKASWSPPADEPDAEWPRVDLYGGLLAENATQATAGLILRRALRMLDEDGWPVVLHTHDEIALEVPESEADEAMENLVYAIKNTAPDFEGLPLNGEFWKGKRYGK